MPTVTIGGMRPSVDQPIDGLVGMPGPSARFIAPGREVLAVVQQQQRIGLRPSLIIVRRQMDEDAASGTVPHRMARHAASVPPLAGSAARPRHGTAGLRPRRPADDRLSDVDGRVFRVRRSRHGRARSPTKLEHGRAAADLRLDAGQRDLLRQGSPAARADRALPRVRALSARGRGARCVSTSAARRRWA